MDEIEICENCKHYMKHYYWFFDRLTNAYSGHCNAHRNKRLVLCKGRCDKWQRGENVQAQQKEKFKDILMHAAKQIETIAEILKVDD